MTPAFAVMQKDGAQQGPTSLCCFIVFVLVGFPCVISSSKAADIYEEKKR